MMSETVKEIKLINTLQGIPEMPEIVFSAHIELISKYQFVRTVFKGLLEGGVNCVIFNNNKKKKKYIIEIHSLTDIHGDGTAMTIVMLTRRIITTSTTVRVLMKR